MPLWSSLMTIGTDAFGAAKPFEIRQKVMRPELFDIVKQQDGTLLNIQLHVGDNDHGFLSVRDTLIRLSGDLVERADAPPTATAAATTEDSATAADSDDNSDSDDEGSAPSLPGSDTLYSKFSSGHRDLDVVQRGNFIDMNGMQWVDCRNGRWEICWVSGKPAGAIVFAFNLPKSYRRNDAVLQEGDMWLSFPVWTVEGLEYAQGRKQEIVGAVQNLLKEREGEVKKYEDTDNPIMEAIHHFRIKDLESKINGMYDYSLETIPDNSSHYSVMQDDLLLSKSGLVWKRNGDHDVLAGRAIVNIVREDTIAINEASAKSRLRP